MFPPRAQITAAAARQPRFRLCTKVVLEKSLVHDLGYMNGAGVTIRNGYECVVRGCDIWNIGGHGVEIYGGNAVRMERCNHIVDNCYIHHVGQFNRHGIGIMVSGAGVVMSHNLIHDMPRCGVFHGGVLHTLEYNRIRHSIVADPLFVDPDQGDFHLRPDSPALRQGFEPIPLEKIGPYPSDARATWPITEAQGVRENPQWLRSVPMD